MRRQTSARVIFSSVLLCSFSLHISAPEDHIAFDLLSLDTPFNMGITEATDNRTALPTNRGTPQLAS